MSVHGADEPEQDLRLEYDPPILIRCVAALEEVEALGSVREQAKKEAEDSLRLKLSEKEEQILAMQRLRN